MCEGDRSNKSVSLENSQPVSHLQCEDADDRLVVTDAVLHVAGVQILSDLQRVLLILFHLPNLLRIQINPVFILLVRGRGFGSDPPQNPVGPGRFPFLTADSYR